VINYKQVVVACPEKTNHDWSKKMGMLLCIRGLASPAQTAHCSASLVILVMCELYCALTSIIYSYLSFKRTWTRKVEPKKAIDLTCPFCCEIYYLEQHINNTGI
jgi:hypothetical protein